MNNDITPTITLAELYESQNQLLDALNIYQKLQKMSPSEKIQEKMEALSEHLMTQKKFKYNELTRTIFSEAELKYFRIISKDSTNLTHKPTIKSKDDTEKNQIDHNNIQSDTDNSKDTDYSDITNTEETDEEIGEKDVENEEVQEVKTEADLAQIFDITNNEEEDHILDSEESELTQQEINTEKKPEEIIEEETDEEQIQNEEINNVVKEIIEIRDQLLQEKQLLLDKAAEIEAKLSKIDIEKLQTALPKNKGMNEKERV